jgi:DNA-binding NtrC family response regulator
MLGHVVIVEDDDDFRDLMGLSLIHQGFTVSAFDSAVAALEFIESNASDVDGLVADVILAHGNGMDVCIRLSELNPRARIVVLTGDNRMVRSATEAGYKALLKPVALEVLKRALTRESEEVA